MENALTSEIHRALPGRAEAAGRLQRPVGRTELRCGPRDRPVD